MATCVVETDPVRVLEATAATILSKTPTAAGPSQGHGTTTTLAGGVVTAVTTRQSWSQSILEWYYN